MLQIGILQLRMHLFLRKDFSQSLLYLKRWWSWPPPTPPSTTYPSCPTAQHLSSPRHVSELVNWNSRSPEVNSWKIRTDYGEPVSVWLRDSQCSFLRNKSVPDGIGTSEDVVEKNEVLRKLLSVTSFFKTNCIPGPFLPQTSTLFSDVHELWSSQTLVADPFFLRPLITTLVEWVETLISHFYALIEWTNAWHTAVTYFNFRCKADKDGPGRGSLWSGRYNCLQYQLLPPRVQWQLHQQCQSMHWQNRQLQPQHWLRQLRRWTCSFRWNE